VLLYSSSLMMTYQSREMRCYCKSTTGSCINSFYLFINYVFQAACKLMYLNRWVTAQAVFIYVFFVVKDLHYLQILHIYIYRT
jgi:hypothetical protein